MLPDRTRVSARAIAVLIGALPLLAALLGASGCSSHGQRSSASADSAGTPAADTASSDADIERALHQAGSTPDSAPDSADIKSAWHDDVAGAELDGLTLAQRAIFLRYANSESCTCGCGYTLTGCLASDMSCEVSGSAITALLDSVRSGRIRGARGLRLRPLRD